MLRHGCRTHLALGGLLLFAMALSAQDASKPEFVSPSQADPAIQRFNDRNVVLTPPHEQGDVPLVVFLPGTHGKPENALDLLTVVANQGYRVIGLSYNDTPAGTELCPRNPDPECFTHFHAVRSFAQGSGPVANSPGESIEGRLVSLLRYLDRQHPAAGWSGYLTSAGQPEWSRLVVSGLSQGAGMAAYIAKLHPVNRVVLFSSPWDNTVPDHRPAPWLSRSSATPADRWWAERHVRENTTAWIANAYRALGIPQQHILLFDAGLADGQNAQGENPYHPSTIRNPVYARQWRQMFGMPDASQPLTAGTGAGR